MFRYGLAAALVASGLGFVHNEGLLDRAAILGSCSPLAAAAPTDSQWWECKPGAVTGQPSLSRDSCRQQGARGELRYWLCPSTLVAGRRTQELASR